MKSFLEPSLAVFGTLKEVPRFEDALREAMKPDIDVGRVRSLCLFLGPYRNLTTLTSAILYLHPSCQILNHGGIQILGRREVDFLKYYSEKSFDCFIRFGLYLSKSGKRGNVGGSIMLSHAFDDDCMKRTFSELNRGKVLKKDIQSFVWKESLRVTNYIKSERVDLEKLLLREKRLRFLMPVRSPIDCAFSNCNSPHHAYQFSGLDSYTLEGILDCVISEIAWFLSWKRRFPDRFFCFLESEFDRSLLSGLAEFLSIECDPRWLDAALSCYRLKHHYEPGKSLVDYYVRSIEKKLKDFPDFAEKLVRAGQNFA